MNDAFISRPYRVSIENRLFTVLLVRKSLQALVGGFFSRNK